MIRKILIINKNNNTKLNFNYNKISFSFFSTTSSTSSSTTSSSSSNITEEFHDCIRNAQATEIFRNTFLSASGNKETIGVSDLDELIIASRSRPSALLGLFQTTGFILGKTSKLLPSECSKLLVNVVNEASLQQFNDTIRNLHNISATMPEKNSENISSINSDTIEEIKETIKYHRDIDLGIEKMDSKDHQEHESKVESEAESEAESNKRNQELVYTTSLYNILKITRKI